MKGSSIKIKTHGLKSQMTSPLINLLAAFENDLIELVKIINFLISIQPARKKYAKIR